MKREICERLTALRAAMKQRGVSALIIPSTDPHSGEYVPNHWKTRAWISGFTGSAGTAVVTLTEAALWVDSRYFIQAEEQLAGTGFVMVKDRQADTPSFAKWLAPRLAVGSVVAIDGWVNTVALAEGLRDELEGYGLGCTASFDAIDTIWTDRPQRPASLAELHPLEFAGESCVSKLSRIREAMTTDAMIVCGLDEIAWTLNIRGKDVAYNPVLLSYLLLTRETAVLFVAPEKMPTDVAEALASEGITIQDYDAVAEALSALRPTVDGATYTVMLDPNRTNFALRLAIPESVTCCYQPSVIYKMKATKNEAEMNGFRTCMEWDGVAMVQILKWLEEAVPQGGQTEISVSEKLAGFRAAQPLFRDLSFGTIAGYKEHGAIVHYEATPETDKPLATESFLLLDSGGQYSSGTTDITRTIPLGTLTDEERFDYTVVLKAHIGMERAKFPEGTCGTQIDVLARGELWQHGLTYSHGTGHGVGSYLNVHEGPHQVRTNHVPAPLGVGMTITDEPGLYKEGRHGIRIENTLLTVPYCTTEFGAFYQFESLTLCPIETSPILREMLTEAETLWLNDYHQMVYRRLSPLLDDAHRAWLAEKTKAI